ncbi:crotonase/enoyl-CoA hydratase family protein [Nocardioides rotundus]|uniref:crotonase/enoyl-CoA hydratase family protein n=1 Tax=Nocardioides rotundus TaxID=1774216 RepID=UPI001CBD04C4|nr:crotonase/enoyl-CoA hydratase family protein [Nocardioides rotundus]
MTQATSSAPTRTLKISRGSGGSEVRANSRPRRIAAGEKGGRPVNKVHVEPAVSDERVLLITLNRPEARNAVDMDVAFALADAFDRLDSDAGLRTAVLTGAGTGFSAGMDLKAFAAGTLPFLEGRGFAGFTQRPPRKPVVAAVEGFALAGGMEMVLACDLVVAARDARLGLPEVQRGLVAAAGGLLRLPQRIPWHVASEIVLTGDPLTAQRLHEIGLINRVTEPGESLASAVELASRISDNAPLALQASKEILARAVDWGLEDGWAHQSPIANRIFSSRDAVEGATAFAQRREPLWRGC